LVWDILPSKEDEDSAMSGMKRVGQEFKTADNDSTYVIA